MTIFHNTSTIQINFPVRCLNQMTYYKVQTDYFYAQRCIRRSVFCIVHDGRGVVCTRGWSDRRSCKRLPVNVHLAVRKSPPLVSSSAKLLEESDVSKPHTRVLSKGKPALFLEYILCLSFSSFAFVFLYVFLLHLIKFNHFSWGNGLVLLNFPHLSKTTLEIKLLGNFRLAVWSRTLMI